MAGMLWSLGKQLRRERERVEILREALVWVLEHPGTMMYDWYTGANHITLVLAEDEAYEMNRIHDERAILNEMRVW